MLTTPPGTFIPGGVEQVRLQVALEQSPRIGSRRHSETTIVWMTLLRGVIAGVVVIAVTELSRRFPRVAALLLTLPVVSIMAFIMAWTRHRDLPAISLLARETLILVPLSLPFFLPLALAEKLGLSFWPAFAIGTALAIATIGTWFWLGPTISKS